MRALNEPIARKVNNEDNCTGRFWEGRYKSQALFDEAALAACMAYVDLNPVRANLSKTPEQSKHTSIFQRAKQAKKGKQPSKLSSFIGNPRKDMPKGLPFTFIDYLELVELTGRCIRDDKRGFIVGDNLKILERLNISTAHWLTLTTEFEHCFHGAAGKPYSINDFCQHQHLKRRQGINESTKLLA